MNSEELELSLRSEFENYLKGVLADMRQEVTEFQNRFEAEIERHREAMNEAFKAFAPRDHSEGGFDPAFSASVSEHLRLARDEGAKISAEAFAEAEKLEKESAPLPVYDRIRDAVNDISGQDSQSSILKSLVQHAADFAPRGGFFIVKNEHLAGWKVFGADESAEDAVRDVHIPVTADTVLGEAVRSQNTVETDAVRSEDNGFLDKVGFGHSNRMYAIPLMARGKAVAVLYADQGSDNTSVNREALETLVRVSGLTVELHAAAAATPAAAPVEVEEQRESTTFAEPAHFETDEHQAPTPFAEPAREEYVDQPIESAFSFEPATTEEATPQYDDSFARAYDETPETTYEEPAYEEPAPAYEPEHEPAPETVNGTGGALVFDSAESSEEDSFASAFEEKEEEEYKPEPSFTPAHEPEYAPVGQPEFVPAPAALEKNIEPVSQVISTPVSRLSDRPVDLPIDVPEQERRLHNDARRFARLLVSEIKLYNEKKVSEGRQAYDLYERLKEAIDRSREMYDKRVQPPVAAKFDYFHYEIVNALAEGNAERLGDGYPGPSN